MAVRAREDLGIRAMEIAFDVPAPAIAGPSQELTITKAMTTISILAMAMVIYLFGGYVDSERRQNNECTKS